MSIVSNTILCTLNFFKAADFMMCSYHKKRERHTETFESDEYVYYLDCDDGHGFMHNIYPHFIH